MKKLLLFLNQLFCWNLIYMAAHYTVAYQRTSIKLAQLRRIVMCSRMIKRICSTGMRYRL